MENLQTDVLVIGSGFGGAAPALRLIEAGLSVLMIEKGPDFRPHRDVKQTQDPQYLLRYIKSERGDNVNFVYAEGLGGGSGFYEMVSLRAPTKAFGQTLPDGSSLWPKSLNRRSLDPYFDIAERMMQVCQIRPEEVPRTGIAFAMLMNELGYSVDRVPYSVRGCRGHSYCVAGCTAGAKVTVHEPYLDPAVQKGMRILTDTEAVSVRPIADLHEEGSKGRDLSHMPFRYLVECRNIPTGARNSIRAKVVILGGGTVGTARLLLASRRFLPELSDHVGKNIAVNGTVKSLGILPDDIPDGDMFCGRSHPGVISYAFLESRGITISTAKPLPVDAVSYANLELDGENKSPSWWGEAKVEIMKLYRRRAIVLYALGLSTPTATLSINRRGEVVPAFTIDESFRRYYNETLALLHSMITMTGGRVVHIHILDGEGVEYPDLHVTTAHMTGSCRMADSPRQGVVNAVGEVFNYPGLYVKDGAAIPSSLAVNPYLTILANAERVGALLAGWYSPKKKHQAAVPPGVELFHAS
jgi:choline dehydrogenase-like flavoprotein